MRGVAGILSAINVQFLLFLVIKYSNVNVDNKVEDNLLKKKVSNIVFIQNQKLLKDLMMDGLANDELRRQEIRAKA